MIFAIPLLVLFIATMATKRFAWESAAGLFWLVLVWLLTFYSHLSRDFIQTDELFFITNEHLSFIGRHALWALLNFGVAATSEYPVYEMRFLNLIVLMYFYSVAITCFNSFRPFTVAVILSYFACVAALNLRDPLIFLALLLLLRNVEPESLNLRRFPVSLKKISVPVLLFMTLRPFQLVIYLVSLLRWYVGVSVLLIGLLALQTNIVQQHFYTITWNVNNFEESVMQRGAGKVEDPQPTPANISAWTLRFLAAPLPWTSFTRVFTEDSYEYGRFDLAVRALHRLLFWGMCLQLLIYFARSPRRVYEHLSSYSHVVKFVAMFSILYAVFNYGGSHERIKMNVFLCTLFLIDRYRCRYTKTRGGT